MGALDDPPPWDWRPVRYYMPRLSAHEINLLVEMVRDKLRPCPLTLWMLGTLATEIIRRETLATHDPAEVEIPHLDLSAWTPANYADAVLALFTMLSVVEGQPRALCVEIGATVMAYAAARLRAIV